MLQVHCDAMRIYGREYERDDLRGTQTKWTFLKVHRANLNGNYYALAARPYSQQQQPTNHALRNIKRNALNSSRHQTIYIAKREYEMNADRQQTIPFYIIYYLLASRMLFLYKYTQNTHITVKLIKYLPCRYIASYYHMY